LMSCSPLDDGACFGEGITTGWKLTGNQAPTLSKCAPRALQWCDACPRYRNLVRRDGGGAG
jgi:hypothetical protein